jgi:hypothetical protein
MGDDWGSDREPAQMTRTFGRSWLPLADIEWVASRSVLYFGAILVAAQGFVGVAGIGKGGEWIIAALGCELFFLAWMANRHGLFVRAKVGFRQAKRRSRTLTIPSLSSDIQQVSIFEATSSESALVRGIVRDSGGTGTSIVVNVADKEIVGVLLSRDEYELLTSAAMVARDPRRMLESLEEHSDPGIPLEEFYSTGAT